MNKCFFYVRPPGALEAEEVGVEHLLRDINDPSVSSLANQVTFSAFFFPLTPSARIFFFGSHRLQASEWEHFCRRREDCILFGSFSRKIVFFRAEKNRRIAGAL